MSETTMTSALKNMEQKFRDRVCNQFLIHGNIADVLPVNSQYISLKSYITDWLKNLKMDIIVFYDLSAGLQFLDKKHEQLFRKLTGFEKPEPKLSEDATTGLSREERERLQFGREALAELENLPEPLLPSKPPDVLKLVEEIAATNFSDGNNSKNNRKYKIAIIIWWAETIAPAEHGDCTETDRVNSVALRRLAEAEVVQNSLVLMVARNLGDISSALRGRGSRLETVEISLPKKAERINYIEFLQKDGFRRKLSLPIAELGHNTGGLSLQEIGNIWRQFPEIGSELISQQKARYLADEFGEVLRIMEPRFGLDKGLGGLESIKEYCREIGQALIKGDPRLVPPAIILMGPPGTGKTALAEALAFEWGVPFVEILNLRSMWVGESERIALKVMSALQALSPCVIFWDEFDQEETPRGSFQGDSGVSSRLRKIRFQITSDPANRGKFLIIYATNRPDLIDPADKRSGRGSTRIPMLLPDSAEKAKIFGVMPRRYGFTTSVGDFRSIVQELERTHGDLISGADIEEISLSAFRRSVVVNHGAVTPEDYFYAIGDFVPHYYNETLIRGMEKEAVMERSSNRFLSPRGKIIAQNLKPVRLKEN